MVFVTVIKWYKQQQKTCTLISLPVVTIRLRSNKGTEEKKRKKGETVHHSDRTNGILFRIIKNKV